MKKYNVGILGATGAVGQEMMKILAERSFPVGELRLLASRNSAGREINGHVVVEACRENFGGLFFLLPAVCGANYRAQYPETQPFERA